MECQSEPGTCPEHGTVLHASEGVYRCWTCDDARIRARQAQRVERANAEEQAGRAQDQATLAAIEQACVRHGFDGAGIAAWIDAQLDVLAALRSKP